MLFVLLTANARNMYNVATVKEVKIVPQSLRLKTWYLCTCEKTYFYLSLKDAKNNKNKVLKFEHNNFN